MDLKNKKIIYLVSIPSIVIILVLILISVSDTLIPESNNAMGNRIPWRTNRCPNMMPIYLFWVGIFLSVISVIPLSLYFSSKKIDSKIESNMSAIMKLLNTNLEKDVKSSDANDVENKSNLISDSNGDTKDNDVDDLLKKESRAIVMKILNHNERKILEKLIETEGTIFQSELSKSGNMTKLNVHRAVKSLEQKEVLSIETYGMTNKLILSEKMKNMLL